MEYSGAYIFWHYFRKGQTSGQIATLITMVIAVIFLFVAVTINIGRIAQKKTVTANAADGAAIKLASYVGSYSHKLSVEYLDGGTGFCKRNFGGLFMILTVVVLVAIAIFAFAIAAPAAAAATQAAGGVTTAAYGATQGVWLVTGALATLGAVFTGYNYYYTTFAMDDGVAASLQRELNKLKFEDNITEQAIMYAMGHCVDDPNRVVDVHDYDEDGRVDDEINQFSKWYAQRIHAITGFASTKEAKIADFLPTIETFAEGAEDFRTTFTEDETRPLIYDDPSMPDDALIPAGESGEFVLLMGELEDLGEEFDVSFWEPGADTEESADDVDGLSTDLNVFYLWALGENGGLLNLDFSNIVLTYDSWSEDLYNEEGLDPEDGNCWYAAWEEHILKIDEWLPELNNLLVKLEEKIFETKVEIEGLEADLDDANAEIEPIMEDITLTSEAITIKNDELTALLETPDPDPDQVAALEAEIAALQSDLAALQEALAPLEEERDIIQADLDAKQGELDHLLDLRTRLVSAVDRLEEFQSELVEFNADIVTFFAQIDDETYEYLRNATYTWHDSAGWHHVRCSVSEVKLPWIRTEKEKEWYGYKMCVYLEDHTGDVTVNLDRFDESVGRSFFARGTIPIWAFKYNKAGESTSFDASDPDQALTYGIKTSATARYTHNSLPTIVSVR